jgi:hypothetical protein
MAILVRNTPAGMDTATYDNISAGMIPVLKKQPGFLMHVAYVTPDGLVVGEVWETREQHQKWFVPVEIKQEIIELHNVVQP